MNLFDVLKGVWRKMTGSKTVEQVLHVTPAVSTKMSDAIQLWTDMYEGHSPWLREPTYENPIRIVSLGLPSLIASEKARMAVLEMESEINAPTIEIEKPNPDYVAPTLDPMGNMSMGRGSMTMKEDVPTGSTERADFLNHEYKKLLKQIRRQLEYGIAKGGLVIKPYPIIYDDVTDDSHSNASASSNTNDSTDIKNTVNERSDASQSTSKNVDNNVESKKHKYNAEIAYDYVQADGFYPLAFDAGGKMIEAAFIQRKIDKEIVYSRVEYHKLERRTVTVQNFAFKNNAPSYNVENIADMDLGQPINLTEVSEWANLEKTVKIEGVDRLLFAYFRMPEANIIDTYSPLGVSGFSRVVNLIKDADMQYSRLLWEYEGGELAIDVDRDALKLVTDKNGNDLTVKPIMQERLFRKIDLNAEDTYNVFAPALRDANYNAGLNTILMRIEDATGLSRGTISDANMAEAKTATELKILKQRSYSTNADIQMALEDTLRDCIYIMDVYCSLYNITPEGEYEVSFEWDDSILVDDESELSKRLTLMQNGLASKIELRMWYFGETENQAKAKLQEIQDEQKQAIEDNMMAQSQLGQMAQREGFNKNPNSGDATNYNSDTKAPTNASTNQNKIDAKTPDNK